MNFIYFYFIIYFIYLFLWIRALVLLLFFISLVAIYEGIFLSSMPEMYLAVFLQDRVTRFQDG